MLITNLRRREPVKICQQLLPLGSCWARGAVSVLLGGFVVCATCPGFDAALPGKWHFQKHFSLVFKILNTCIKSRGSDKEPPGGRTSLAFGGQAHTSCLCRAGLAAAPTSCKMSPCLLPVLLQSKSSLRLGFATFTKPTGAERDWGWQPGGGRAGTSRPCAAASPWDVCPQPEVAACCTLVLSWVFHPCSFRACAPFPRTVRFEIRCRAIYNNLNWQQAHGMWPLAYELKIAVVNSR